MDPGTIGVDTWSEIGELLTNLWIVVLFIMLFAANMILGHSMVPSLVASEHLSRSYLKTRPVFYTLALAFFGLAMLFLAQVVNLAGVLRDFWPSYWI